MPTETWMFENEANRDAAKESLGLRHPANKTEWIDDYTVKIEDPHNQVSQFLRSHKAKKID